MACSFVCEGSCCSVVVVDVGITWGLSSSVSLESSESLSELLESSSLELLLSLSAFSLVGSIGAPDGSSTKFSFCSVWLGGGPRSTYLPQESFEEGFAASPWTTS